MAEEFSVRIAIAASEGLLFTSLRARCNSISLAPRDSPAFKEVNNSPSEASFATRTPKSSAIDPWREIFYYGGAAELSNKGGRRSNVRGGEVENNEK